MRALLAVLLLSAPASAQTERHSLFDGAVSVRLPTGFTASETPEVTTLTSRPIWETLALGREFAELARIARADGEMFGDDSPDCAAEAAFPYHFSCKPAESLTLRLLPLDAPLGQARFSALFTPPLPERWRQMSPEALLAGYCPPPNRGRLTPHPRQTVLTCYRRDAVTERPTVATRLAIAPGLALHSSAQNGLLAAQINIALFSEPHENGPTRAEAHAAYDRTREGYWRGLSMEALAGEALLDAVTLEPATAPRP